MKHLMNIYGEIPHAGISNISIPLMARNLIITGKNGSGKTSFLNLLSDKVKIHLTKAAQKKDEINRQLEYWNAELKKSVEGSHTFSQAKRQIEYQSNELQRIDSGLHLEFLEELELINNYDNLRAIFAFYKAMRIASIQETKHTSSIEEEKNNAINSIRNNQDVNFGNKLEQHLVNIKVNQSLSITEDNNQVQADKFQNWFDSFDDHLKFLFEDNSAHLVFYRQNYKFKISLNNREFDFQTLSSGYLAIFEILADLLVRSEFFDITPDQLQGIVIIDEIDAHLHISLQKKILPFFIRLFPHLQFIVSTHSPFVITSTSDETVIYDISSGEFFEDNLNQYSYESVIKGLFHVSTVSFEAINSIKSLKNLLNEDQINFEAIRAIVKELKPLETTDVLDKKIKNLYLQAINILADHDELEDLDV